MKKILKFMVVVPAAATLCGAAAMADTGRVAIALHLRTGPGPQNAIVATMPANAAVDVKGRLRGSFWCRVSYRGVTGWAYSKYIAYHGPVVALARPAPTVAVAPPPTVAVAPPVVEEPAVATNFGINPLGPVGAALLIPGAVLGSLFGPVTVEPAYPPATVVVYAEAHPVRGVRVAGEVQIGAGLPQAVVIYPVPGYRYGYAVVNGRTIFVRPSDRRIVYVG